MSSELGWRRRWRLATISTGQDLTEDELEAKATADADRYAKGADSVDLWMGRIASGLCPCHGLPRDPDEEDGWKCPLEVDDE